MTRLLIIAAFLLGVLYASGFSLPLGASQAPCADTCGAMHADPVQAAGCCPLNVADDYCPMSGGPCVCGLAPSPDQPRHDPVPMPQRERDTVQMVRAPPPVGRPVGFVLTSPHLGALTQHDYLAGFTHNQTQAILGVWRR